MILVHLMVIVLLSHYCSRSFCLSATTSMPNSAFTITYKAYFTLLDAITKERESKQELAQKQVELQQLVTQIQKELVDTKMRVTMLENATLISHENFQSENETNIVRQDYENLKEEHATLQSKYQLLQQEVKSTKSNILPILNEIALLKQQQKNDYLLCRNETVRLQENILKTNETVNMLMFSDKARGDDLVAFHNELLANKRNIDSLKVEANDKYDGLAISINVSVVTCERKISGVHNMLETKIQQFGEMSNVSVQNLLGSIDKQKENSNILKENLTKAIHQISSRLNDNVSVIEMELNSQVNILSDLYNTTFENLSRGIDKLKEGHNFLELNLTKTLIQVSKTLNKNISRLENEVKELNDLHNTTVQKLVSVVGKLEKKSIMLESNLTEATGEILTSCSINLSKVEGEVHKLNEIYNSSIQSILGGFDKLTDRYNFLENNLTREMHRFSNICNRNISRVEEKLQKCDVLQNATIESVISSIDKLDEKSKTLYSNLTQARHLITNIYNQTISEFKLKLIGEVETLQEIHNTSVSSLTAGIDELKTQSKIQENNLTQTMAKISAKCDQNIFGIEKELKSEVQKLTELHNTSVDSLSGDIADVDQKLSVLSSNLTEAWHQISINSEKVALTACSNTQRLKSGSIIIFPSIRTAHGIQGLTDFSKTGKFSSEKSGLYLIAAQIMSYSKGAEYKITKNSKEVTRVQVTPYHDSDTHNYHTGTGIATVELNINDTVWIQVQEYVNEMNVFGSESCLTIIKLK